MAFSEHVLCIRVLHVHVVFEKCEFVSKGKRLLIFIVYHLPRSNLYAKVDEEACIIAHRERLFDWTMSYHRRVLSHMCMHSDAAWLKWSPKLLMNTMEVATIPTEYMQLLSNAVGDLCALACALHACMHICYNCTIFMPLSSL